MLKTTTKRVVEVQDWDKLVQETYKKPYHFQQQNGCQERGNHYLSVPAEVDGEEEGKDSVPLEINGEDMGVSFKAWLAADPKDHQKKKKWADWEVEMFWQRNFYPNIQAIANDLHEKGLIEKGEYTINIDW